MSHPRLFAVYLRVTGRRKSAARGPHILTDDLSPRELVARLERSPFAGHARVTFPEGWTRFDMARRLAQSGVCTLRSFLDATTDPELLHSSCASTVFRAPRVSSSPRRTIFNYDADAKDVVRRMKTEFDRRWSIAEGRARRRR